MKKFVFLLALIYSMSCNPCYDLGDPSTANDCISRNSSNKNEICCFQEIIDKDKNIVDGKECLSIKDDKEEINKYIQGYTNDMKNNHNQNIEVKVKCTEDEDAKNNSSYLKIGLILILGLLF